jgi:hypothetical protein
VTEINIEAKNRKLYTLTFDKQPNTIAPFRTFHISDIHFDSKSCDREKLKRDLDMCLREDRYIFIYGDIFDVMCTYTDKRRSYDLMRPEYVGDNYLNLVIDDVCKFFKPYAKNIAHLSYGNHETAIRKFHSADVLEILHYSLQHAGSPALLSPYTGFIKMTSTRGGRKNLTKTIHYHHGHEGGRRSKGTLKVDTDQAKVEADIHLSGHNHQKWSMPWGREYIERTNNELRIRRGYHVNMGTYKDKSKSGMGWSEEKSFGCPGIGGYCIDFFRSEDTLDYHVYEPAPWVGKNSFKNQNDPLHKAR